MSPLVPDTPTQATMGHGRHHQFPGRDPVTVTLATTLDTTRPNQGEHARQH